jgi:hypothetical protein
MGVQQCYSQNQFGGFADVQGSAVEGYGYSFCVQHIHDYMKPGDAKLTYSQDQYFYSIEWKDGCQVETTSQDMYYPLAKAGQPIICGDIFRGCYSNCKFPFEAWN